MENQKIVTEIIQNTETINKFLNEFPISKNNIIIILVLSIIHLFVSLFMVFKSITNNKNPFVYMSRIFWVISLIVCVILIVFSILELKKIQNIDNEVNKLQYLSDDLKSILSQIISPPSTNAPEM